MNHKKYWYGLCLVCKYKLSRPDARYCVKHKGIAISKSRMGIKPSEETRRKLVESHLGKAIPIEVREKMSKSHKKIREKSHLWKGGITQINHKIRTSFEYRLWRESVFKRDNWTCTWCGIRSKKGLGRITLNADHIKSFALYPELRFVLSNGRTLCIDCHCKTESYGVNIKH